MRIIKNNSVLTGKTICFMLLLCLLGTLLSGCGIADKTGLTGGGNGAKRAIAVDESVHVVDMEFIRDGDTLQYHRRLNEDNYDEYATLTRTGEDPTDVYLSYIQ